MKLRIAILTMWAVAMIAVATAFADAPDSTEENRSPATAETVDVPATSDAPPVASGEANADPANPPMSVVKRIAVFLGIIIVLRVVFGIIRARTSG